ncbi:FecR family protein [Caulobacter endophyticus]|uniref:FecR family protein n=1 Tax=Caulobacter endophyticus TaxID=2172652 RepID=UPI0024101CF0|nr:FecR domain-containing protein [Caulobacter endophyticus]MDG2527901.1 FecR domain-containing protein [Caulobacter endophyticus]
MRELLTLGRLKAMDPSEAAALLLYRREDGGGDIDAAVLADWLALDPAHQTAWIQALAAWSDFDDGVDDEILAALRAQARSARPRRASWAPRAAVAAAVVVLAAGGGLGLWLQEGVKRGNPGTPIIAQAPDARRDVRAYAATGDGPQVFQLNDGTRMTLAAGAAADVTLAEGRRDVRLARGRAFFDVAHDARRPFAVQAQGQEILALGTRFDVLLASGELRVVLLEGKVSVRPVGAAGQAALLAQGEQLVARDGRPARVSPADVGEAVAWRQTFVVFDDVTLAEAARELSLHGAGRLTVRDPAVAALRIRGRFKTGDLPRFGRSLALLHPVRLVRRGPDEWEIVAVR